MSTTSGKKSSTKQNVDDKASSGTGTGNKDENFLIEKRDSLKGTLMN